MYLVAIGWMFVVVLMSAAEAMSPIGTVLGALITLLLYGALPLSIVLYVMGAPGRRKARRATECPKDAASRRPSPPGIKESGEAAFPRQRAAGSASPDGSAHAAGDAVAPERKEP